jgi:hypothetical protein
MTYGDHMKRIVLIFFCVGFSVYGMEHDNNKKRSHESLMRKGEGLTYEWKLTNKRGKSILISIMKDKDNLVIPRGKKLMSCSDDPQIYGFTLDDQESVTIDLHNTGDKFILHIYEEAQADRAIIRRALTEGELRENESLFPSYTIEGDYVDIGSLLYIIDKYQPKSNQTEKY